MHVLASRRSAGGLLLLSLIGQIAGCGSQTASPGPQAAAPGAQIEQATQPVSTEPGEIELFDPTVTLTAPDRVRFDVHYRFTKGKPDKFYMCEVSFPATPNRGNKLMDSWELKSEGVIKDGIVLFKPPVEEFTIRMLETDSPQKGYHPISNTVSGKVQ